MLFLLRNIRRKLLTSNKVTTYLLYAVGEIVLVVVGILIAVQIDDWNQNNKDKLEVNKYLINISKDLKGQLDEIENQLEFEQKTLQLCNNLINQFNTNKGFDYSADLMHNLSNINTRTTFTSKNVAFVEMQSSGKLNLMNQLKIKDSLIIYYDYLTRVSNVIQKNNDFVDNEMFNPLIDKIIIENLDIPPSFIRNLQSEGITLHRPNPDALKKYVALQLKEDAIKVQLLNLISYRQTIATIHIAYLLTLKEKTKRLLNQTPYAPATP